MDAAWPRSDGEAIHTSTFLGHPVGCAMALAEIAEIDHKGLVERSAENGRLLLDFLANIRAPKRLHLCARGLGLMAGLELRHADGSPATSVTIQVIKVMLRRGFILLPDGEHANVIGFTPPLTITAALLKNMVRQLEKALNESA